MTSTQELYQLFLKSSGICTDTRKIKKDSIFFALKGDNFNGNLFAKEALEKGAMAAVIDEGEEEKDMYKVSNGLTALQNLATYYRDTFQIPIIGLTGSNGKTTTKELLHSVLATTYIVHSTKGNLNNHIGVPLTILSMPQDTEIAIVEMGANHVGEIKELCEIAKPNFGVITNIGKAHLEGFGGLEGVLKGKTELYRFIQKASGTFFVNDGDEKLSNVVQDEDAIRFTTPEIKRSNPFQLEFYLEGNLVKSFLYGDYNLKNIAAAMAIGKHFKVKPLDVIYGIERYVPTNNRSQVVKKKKCTFILDAYNANPSSMEESLSNFSRISGKKMAIIGAMKELGEFSLQEHQQLYNLVFNLSLDEVVFVGKEFEKVVKSTDKFYDSVKSLKENLQLSDYENWSILLKGSRSIRLEEIIL